MSRADQKPHKYEHLYVKFWECLETELDANQISELVQKPKKAAQAILREMAIHGFVAVRKNGKALSYSRTGKRPVKRFSRSAVFRQIQKELDRKHQSITELAASTGYSIHYLAKVIRDMHRMELIVIAEWGRSNLQKVRILANKSDDYQTDAKFVKITYKLTLAPYYNRRKWKRRNGSII